MNYREEWDVPHALRRGCDLRSSANVWNQCVCADIDPSDRPCSSCEAIALSAERCTGCATIRDARREAR